MTGVTGVTSGNRRGRFQARGALSLLLNCVEDTPLDLEGAKSN